MLRSYQDDVMSTNRLFKALAASVRERSGSIEASLRQMATMIGLFALKETFAMAAVPDRP